MADVRRIGVAHDEKRAGVPGVGELAVRREDERLDGRERVVVLLQNAMHHELAFARSRRGVVVLDGRVVRDHDSARPGIRQVACIEYGARECDRAAVHRHRLRAVVVELHSPALRAADRGVAV